MIAWRSFCFLVLLHLVPQPILADNIRPVYLEIEELSSRKNPGFLEGAPGAGIAGGPETLLPGAL